MSHVRIYVNLDNGAGMSFGPAVAGTPAKDDVSEALSKLDSGYKLLRAWLESQLPPPRRPVEVRSGPVRLKEAREVAKFSGLGMSVGDALREAALRREAEASTALDGDTQSIDGAYTYKPSARPVRDNPQA